MELNRASSQKDFDDRNHGMSFRTSRNDIREELAMIQSVRRLFPTKICLVLLLLFLSAPVSSSEEGKPVKPQQKDKCPVCGMFVAKYPDFVAEIIFKDKSYAVFDGAKDMFRYYFNLAKYDPKKKQSDTSSVFVTSYYTLTLVDGFKAYYVIGSDVYGPMGRELIPFENLSDAQSFLKDHKGKTILKFKDISYETIKGLD
jgi:copper chaperone NosL